MLNLLANSCNPQKQKQLVPVSARCFSLHVLRCIVLHVQKEEVDINFVLRVALEEMSCGHYDLNSSSSGEQEYLQ